jgi:hypothetical protein
LINLNPDACVKNGEQPVKQCEDGSAPVPVTIPGRYTRVSYNNKNEILLNFAVFFNHTLLVNILSIFIPRQQKLYTYIKLKKMNNFLEIRENFAFPDHFLLLFCDKKPKLVNSKQHCDNLLDV